MYIFSANFFPQTSTTNVLVLKKKGGNVVFLQGDA
jgi:hypothetical protein